MFNVVAMVSKLQYSYATLRFNIYSDIQQIIRGILNIEIQLNNEEYECVIAEKSSQSKCPVNLPPVLTIPPPPPTAYGITYDYTTTSNQPILTTPSAAKRRGTMDFESTTPSSSLIDCELGIPPQPPAKPYRLRKQSIETLYQPTFKPSPLPEKRLPKPMLRSKIDLIAERSIYSEPRPFRQMPIYNCCEYIQLLDRNQEYSIPAMDSYIERKQLKGNQMNNKN